MKLFKLAAVAATGILLSAGIAGADDKPVVGLIMKSLANEFFQNMLEGAEAHACGDGVSVEHAGGELVSRRPGVAKGVGAALSNKLSRKKLGTL